MKQYLKKWISLSVILIYGISSFFAYADRLNVAPFFKEDFARNSSVTMIAFSGEQTDWKGLTIYKSVSVTGDPAKADEIARNVGKDGAKAEFKETSFKDGRLYFGFY